MDQQKTSSTTPESAQIGRHWVDLEELDSKYWSDPKVQEKRAQEFYEKPVEFIDMLDKTDKAGLARRDFLTIMGASMAMASFSCARRPVHKIIPYVVQPEEITPGVATWYASTNSECGHGCGVLIKNREGRPIKLEGNPDHPVNRGALCARGQASVLNLYDPDRLKQPMEVAREGAGATRAVSWADADAAIQAKLKGAGRVSIISGAITSDSTNRLIREFLSAFKSSDHVQYEPLELTEIADAQMQSYGTAVIPHYHFDRAETVVSIGADFLGGWVSPVEHANDWVKNRKLAGKDAKQAKLSKLVTFESMMTITGANSDERYPVRPGDELKIALALAHEIIIKGGRSRFAGDAAVASALSGYKLEGVVEEIGIEGGVEKLRKLASDLWETRGKSLVVGGDIHSRTRDALQLQIAINLLNSALENEGATVDGTINVRAPKSDFAALAKLIAEMKAGKVDVLLLYRSNPVYTLPKSAGFDEALKNVKFVVTVSDREDETGVVSNYVLPDHHFLESWGDSSPRRGLYSVQQPAMAPIHSSRAFQDSLLVWIKGAALRTESLASRVALAAAGQNTWHDYLKTHWRETIYRENGVTSSFDQFWEGVLRAGVFNARSAQGVLNAGAAPRAFRTAALAQTPKYAQQSSGDVILALYANPNIYDGRYANNPWMQELPDQITTVTWDNYLAVGPTLAKRLNVKNDDVVEVLSGGIRVELPVRVQPGMHPNSVAAAIGYGRTHAGKVGTEAGVDLFPMVAVENGRMVFAGMPVKLAKTGRFYRLAATQWHTVTENRPIINDITFADFKKDPSAGAHTDPHLRLEKVPTIWPEHEYKGYRWGMAIDLSSCIGCNACMVACQAENNVPVVGRDQVRVARNMHWIRIDRYYSGNPENPDVVFQPMLCQHCENAPCETVCPVLATVHDDEGTNVQVYNRCVGTRYCQNNCPYKVRRFNFFDHWKSYESTMNMAWNPDVTVRTRGIMEKCTFCIQRIREAKDHAKDQGEKVKDGDLKTACQQTCPTNAIIFGDINDPNTRVSKLREDPTAFRVLEVLNTKPSISYLSKIRNKAGSSHGAGAHGSEHHS